jgi:phenylalanyl-tRNA synthetase beta chain
VINLDIQFEYEAGEINGLHPGRTAYVELNGEIVGFVGPTDTDINLSKFNSKTYVRFRS